MSKTIDIVIHPAKQPSRMARPEVTRIRDVRQRLSPHEVFARESRQESRSMAVISPLSATIEPDMIVLTRRSYDVID